MSILSLVPNVLPVRPFFPQPDQVRAEQQQARYDLLTGDWEQRAIEWNQATVEAEVLQAWGSPDTSCNTIADMTRQYTTPGLYGDAPTITHADAAGRELAGSGGKLEASGYWAMMRRVEYLAVGMGDFLVAHDVVGKDLTHRLVRPQDVVPILHPLNPTRWAGLCELRLRWRSDKDAWCYTWDVWDLGVWEEDATGKIVSVQREASFRVMEGLPTDANAQDISNLFNLPAGGVAGAAFRWRDLQGRPRFPYTVYRLGSGSVWNILDKRDAMVGALNSARNWTFAGACARDATGKTVIAAGLVPLSANTKNAGTQNRVQSVALRPGALVYHDTVEGMQPFVAEVGPGSNLPEVLAYAERYELRQAVRWGLSSTDIEKAGADQQSGAALLLTRSAKREFGEQVKPWFRTSDLEAVKTCAMLLRVNGVSTHPEEGYSVDYAPIPLSQPEQVARREQIDWEVERGFKSELEAYMEMHPGITETAAMSALVQVAIQKAQLAQDIEAGLRAAGLAKPAPPKTHEPPPPGKPGEPDPKPEDKPPADPKPPEPPPAA